jgi:hypothetical protein
MAFANGGTSLMYCMAQWADDSTDNIASEAGLESWNTSVAYITDTYMINGGSVGATFVSGSVYLNAEPDPGASEYAYINQTCTGQEGCGVWEADYDCDASVYSISPTYGAVGDSVPVTISGPDVASADLYADSGLSIDITDYSDDNNISGTLSIAYNASAGNHTITVDTVDADDAEVSFGVGFFVQVPTSLSVVSGGVSVASLCPPPTGVTFGIKIAVLYQLDDQLGNPIQLYQTDIYEPTEDVTATITDSLGVHHFNGTPGFAFATPLYVPESGQFTDVPLGACDPHGAFTGSISQSISISIVGTGLSPSVRSNSYTISSSSSLTGTISNGVDISASR